MTHAFAELAKRTEEITPFLAVEVFERAQELERQGHEVVHLEFGEPDFETPEVVREAAVRAIRDGRTRYTHSLGILPLREAIAEHYQRTYRVAVSPDQVLVTAGTSPAMLLLFTGLLSAGDEVVLSDPHYACYPNFVRYADAVPVYVPAPESDGLGPPGRGGARAAGSADPGRDGELARESHRRGDARGPAGGPRRPGGTAGLLARVRRDLPRSQLRGARPHRPRVHGPRVRVQRLLEGVRDDRMASRATSSRPRRTSARLQRLHQNFFISSNEFVQWAGVAALREAGPDVQRFRAVFDERRRAMVDGLRAVGFGVGVEPTGAFYVFADARRFCERSYDFAFEILAGARVAVTPGIDFGAGGEGYLRVSYANSLPRIREALARLHQFLRDREARR